MITHGKIATHTYYSSFHSSLGSDQYFLITSVSNNGLFRDTLQNLYKSYQASLKKLHLSAQSEVYCRFYVNDIANQSNDFIKIKKKYFTENISYCLIQQPPLPDSISLFTYHISSKKEKHRKHVFQLGDLDWRGGVQFDMTGYSLYFTGNFAGRGVLDSYVQTNDIFSRYNNFLNDNKMTLLQNTIRTWIYVRDIENHYQGMVDARREYFFEQGLSPQTRFIASTGIEGKMSDSNSLVSLDAISITPLDQKQIVRMEALENLNSTSEYKVTFERGTKVEFGDRNHLYISGTASIDKCGQVLYEGDIGKQTKRSLDNIKALLNPHNASLEDMLYLIVYIRNRSHYPQVRKVLAGELSKDIPILYVEAAVCRSGWLVEIEGEAIVSADNSWAPFK